MPSARLLLIRPSMSAWNVRVPGKGGLDCAQTVLIPIYNHNRKEVEWIDCERCCPLRRPIVREHRRGIAIRRNRLVAV